MNISMFLVFPGILITIGVFLLILSIIIVIIAYKTADKPLKNSLVASNYDTSIKEKDYYDNENPKVVLEANSKNKEQEENKIDNTKVFKFPASHKNVPISEVNNDVSDRINKMDEEFAKEMDNTSNKDEFIKIPPIDTPTKEEEFEELEPKESNKETKEDDDDIELL